MLLNISRMSKFTVIKNINSAEVGINYHGDRYKDKKRVLYIVAFLNA